MYVISPAGFYLLRPASTAAADSRNTSINMAGRVFCSGVHARRTDVTAYVFENSDGYRPSSLAVLNREVGGLKKIGVKLTPIFLVLRVALAAHGSFAVSQKLVATPCFFGKIRNDRVQI